MEKNSEKLSKCPVTGATQNTVLAPAGQKTATGGQIS